MYFREQSKKKAVTFSYDDGTVQDVHLIELMNKYGLKGTFNLNSEQLGTHPIRAAKDGMRNCRYRIHPEDVRSVYEGHEIAAHTLTHPHLYDLDDAELIREIEQDRLNLSELAGYEVVGLAYPFGDVDDRIARVVREHTGIKYARAVKSTPCFDVQSDLYRFAPNAHSFHHAVMMERARAFLETESDKPQILYIWGHAYEFDLSSDAWVKLEELFQLIGNREDIFYGTNAQVLL